MMKSAHSARLDPVERASGDVRGLARGGMANVAGTAVAATASFLVVLAVTRSLSPTEAGIFFSATSVFLIAATVARLGTPTGLVFFISGDRAAGRPARERQVLRLALGPVVGLATMLALLLLASGWAVGYLRDGSTAAHLIVVIALFLPLATASDVVLAGTRGLGSMRATVLFESLVRACLQLALVGLAALTGSVTLVAVGWAIPYAVALALGSSSFRRSTSAADVRPGNALSRTEFWRFTAPRSVTSVVQIALQRLDIVLVAVLLGPAEAAIYAVASRFMVLGQMGSQAVSFAAQPKIRAALARQDMRRAETIYRTATGWVVLMSWPIYLSCIVYADWLMRIFGPGYASGRVVVVVLCCTMLLAAACGMVDMVLSMGGRTWWNLADNAAALAVNVTANLVLLPTVGIVGAAIAWSLAILVNNLTPLYQIMTSFHVHPFSRSTTAVMAAAVGCFLLLPVLAEASSEAAWTRPAGTAVGVALYLAIGWSLRHQLAVDALASALRRRAAPSRPPSDSRLEAASGSVVVCDAVTGSRGGDR